MADQKIRSSKRMRWALGLSLAVNLLVVGLVAGAAYRVGGPHEGADGGPGGNLRNYGTPYIAALPQDRRRAIFKDLRANTGVGHMNRAARRAQYDQALEALRAVPFDLARVGAVLDAQREATLGVQQAVQDAWLTEIAAMDAPARAAYADRLQEVLERGPRRPHDKDRHRPQD